MEVCLWVIGFLEETDFKANLPVKICYSQYHFEGQEGVDTFLVLLRYIWNERLCEPSYFRNMSNVNH